MAAGAEEVVVAVVEAVFEVGVAQAVEEVVLQEEAVVVLGEAEGGFRSLFLCNLSYWICYILYCSSVQVSGPLMQITIVGFSNRILI